MGRRRSVRHAPYIHYWIGPDDCWHVEDTRSGQRYRECSELGFKKRVADLSVSEEYYPLGEKVKAIASYFGAASCAPCEQRRAVLNRLLRRVRLR